MPDHMARHFFALSSYEESTERNYDSSPHVRGRLMAELPDFVKNRFIPPCEGPTLSGLTTAAQSMIHPPHVRGRPCADLSKKNSGRFIPPCEGPTLSVYTGLSVRHIVVVQFVQFHNVYTLFTISWTRKMVQFV